MVSKSAYASFHNEGCDLHYWYVGSGPLLTFIPGGNGYDRQYNALMATLSSSYTYATFDPRSLGGLIGLQLARDDPGIIDHLICHDPPAMAMLPDASDLCDWLVKIYEIYKTTSSTAEALLEFKKMFVGMEDEGVPATMEAEAGNKDNFFENKLWAIRLALPNLRRVKANRVSIGLMNGARSRDAPYARALLVNLLGSDVE